MSGFDSVHQYQGQPRSQPLTETPSLWQALLDARTAYANRPAVTTFAADGTVQGTRTYQQLFQDANQFCTRLRVLGARPGDSLGIPVTNSLDSLTSILGALQARVPAVLVDARQPPDRVGTQLHDLTTFVVTPDEGIRRHASLETKGAFLSEEALAAPFRTALAIYTTGSTATSKAVAQSGYSALQNIVAVANHHALNHATLMVCPLPISHANALHFGVFSTLVCGGHAVLLERFGAELYLRILKETEASITTTVPAILRAITSVRSVPSLPGLAYFVSAAAPLDPVTAGNVYERLDRQIVQGYGLTESMNFATTMPTDLTLPEYQRLVLDAAIPPVGGALKGCETASSEAVGSKSGEILLRGHNIMNGYIGAPDETETAFEGGWFHTGDVGSTIEDERGELVVLQGRLKNIVKCGGLAVSLDELDRVARTVEGTIEACAVGRKHELLGEAVTIFHVGGTSEGISRAIREIAPVSAIGLRVVALETMPTIGSGKYDRPRLRLMA